MESEHEETSHVPLPDGLYKYGDAYASGVCPVIGAHGQFLWYSVPGMYTRFTDLEEAEGIVLQRAELRSEIESYKNMAIGDHHSIERLYSLVCDSESILTEVSDFIGNKQIRRSDPVALEARIFALLQVIRELQKNRGDIK